MVHKKVIRRSLGIYKHWLTRNESIGLHQAAIKTEFIFLLPVTGAIPRPWSEKYLKYMDIEFCATLKYLQLWFDEKLSFYKHTKKVTKKTEQKMASQSSFYAELKNDKRKTESLLMKTGIYGTPVWSDNVNILHQRLRCRRFNERLRWGVQHLSLFVTKGS